MSRSLGEKGCYLHFMCIGYVHAKMLYLRGPHVGWLKRDRSLSLPYVLVEFGGLKLASVTGFNAAVHLKLLSRKEKKNVEGKLFAFRGATWNFHIPCSLSTYISLIRMWSHVISCKASWEASRWVAISSGKG